MYVLYFSWEVIRNNTWDLLQWLTCLALQILSDDINHAEEQNSKQKKHKRKRLQDWLKYFLLDSSVSFKERCSGVSCSLPFASSFIFIQAGRCKMLLITHENLSVFLSTWSKYHHKVALNCHYYVLHLSWLSRLGLLSSWNSGVAGTWECHNWWSNFLSVSTQMGDGKERNSIYFILFMIQPWMLNILWYEC